MIPKIRHIPLIPGRSAYQLRDLSKLVMYVSCVILAITAAFLHQNQPVSIGISVPALLLWLLHLFTPPWVRAKIRKEREAGYCTIPGILLDADQADVPLVDFRFGVVLK